MNERTPSLVREAASAVPEIPGDLQAVRERAARRSRRQHAAMALTVILVLAGVALGVGRLLERPAVPVIGGDGSRPVLLVDLCGESDCPAPRTDPDEALAAARSVRGVREVVLIDAEDVAASLRAAGYPDNLTATDVGPNLAVSLEAGANLHDIAVRLQNSIRNAGVRVRDAMPPTEGPPADFPERPVLRAPLNGFDPDARTGRVVRLASSPLGELRRWPVAGGGICFALADRPACTSERLYGGAEALAYAVADGWSCTWGIVDDRTTSIEISYLDGSTADADLGPPGDRLLGGFTACVEGTTGPNSLTAIRPNGESSHHADAGHTIVDEIRTPGTPSRHAIGLAIQEQLNTEALVDVLATHSETEAAAALREQLEQVHNPPGVTAVEIVDVHADGTGDFPVRAQLTIDTENDHPFCLGITVGEWVWADTQLPPGRCPAG